MGIYVHIPYCRSKCIYCDFFSAGAATAQWKRLREAIVTELRQRKGELPARCHTLYIGGGTPSLMPGDEFSALAETLLREGNFPTEGPGEFTIEVNPEDVTRSSARIWRDAGVNRVSMGVQTLVDSELKTIRRSHDSAKAIDAASILRDNFPNLSLDVIFGIPGQTPGSLKQTLNGIISLKPDHISAYSMMYEEGTPLTALAERGAITPVGDDDCVEMYYLITDMLREAGYEHYEISNYALPGKRSRHNSSYWSGAPYLGLGPGAHSYDGERIRRSNPWRLRQYLERFAPAEDSGRLAPSPFYEEEHLSDTELLEEYVMLRMRTREGIDLREMSRRFGETLAAETLAKAQKAGNSLSVSGDRISLSREGLMLSDAVILGLL